MKKTILSTLLVVTCAVGAFAGDQATLQETSRLSQDLIYSVNRSPERPFDTARAVDVITAEEIANRPGRGLADILEETTGVYIRRWGASGGAAVVRGLSANQVLILIDGVKLTNGTWGSETSEYLNLVDVSQIDRVEVVRGVVSVLGTESLGGIINIITKKGPPGGETVTGTVGLHYSSGDRGFAVPLTIAGQAGKLRYSAGITARDANDMRSGSQRIRMSGYNERSGYLSAQYLLSDVKTLTATYSDLEQSDIRGEAPGLIGPIFYKPVHTQLASLSYLDLATRGWSDSLRAQAYWNKQSDGHDVIVVVPSMTADRRDSDTLFGFGLELGKFVGKSQVHHLVYGVDYSTEETESVSMDTYLDSGAVVQSRSRTTPGAQYRTLGVYLHDRFDIGSRLTASVGARYGTFSLKAKESGFLGTFALDESEGDYSASVNLVYHATSQLNIVGNAMRGFRTPNIYDATAMVWGASTLQVPSTNVSTEHVMSYELGAKFEAARFSGSAFYFRNDLDNLLVRTQGLLNGLPYHDGNGNGTRDPWEGTILQNQNIGAGTIDGFELEGRAALARDFSLQANYTHTVGTNSVSDEPFPFIPPSFGTVKLRYSPASTKGYWGEAALNFAGSQDRISSIELADPALAHGTPSYNVFNLRGGATLFDKIGVTLEIENLFDEDYRYHGSHVPEAGRQFVVSTQYRF
ncbi:MAG TPA: TonB-dependent receptor [Thermoanaerobaculia bacterium]